LTRITVLAATNCVAAAVGAQQPSAVVALRAAHLFDGKGDAAVNEN
jgi:hypothetical protein